MDIKSNWELLDWYWYFLEKWLHCAHWASKMIEDKKQSESTVTTAKGASVVPFAYSLDIE